MDVMMALGEWLGRTASRIHGWFIHRRDRKLPRGFWGEETT